MLPPKPSAITTTIVPHMSKSGFTPTVSAPRAEFVEQPLYVHWHLWPPPSPCARARTKSRPGHSPWVCGDLEPLGLCQGPRENHGTAFLAGMWAFIVPCSGNDEVRKGGEGWWWLRFGVRLIAHHGVEWCEGI